MDVTEDKDFKRVVRDRAAKTGESYSAARANLMATAGAADDAMRVVRDGLATSVAYFWESFRPQLRGLTDEEYRWEPTSGCPTIRQQADGTWTVDHQFPLAGAASIAQRACWAGQFLRGRTNQHFGDKSLTPDDLAAVPGDAKSGIDYLDEAVREWHTALAACSPSFLLEHSENTWPGAIDGQFPMVTTTTFMFQLLVESCGHIASTRDFYLRAHPDIVGAR